MIKQTINGISSIGGSIARGVSNVAGFIFGGISYAVTTGVTFIANTATAVLVIGKNNVVSGYETAAQYTIDDVTPAAKSTKDSIPTWIAKLVLSPFTALPGFITGLVIFPTLYYSAKNIGAYFNLPFKILMSDEAPYDAPKYKGGPLVIFGAPGVVLGFVLGTIFQALPFAVVRVIANTWHSITWSFQFGLNLAAWDTKNKLVPEDNRNTFRRIMGLIPFGLPLGLLSFAVSLIGMTTVRLVINSFVSAYRLIKQGFKLSVWDLELGKSIDIGPDNRSVYQKVLGLIGSIVGLGLGAAVFLGSSATRSVVHSVDNFLRVLSRFANPFLKGSSIENAFNYSKGADKFNYGEHFLGFPGYLLSPVAGLIGGFVGASIRISRASFRGTVDAVTFMLNTSLKGVEKYKPMEYGKARKSYEIVLGVLGYPVGAIIISPIVSLIGLVRYVATNIDTGNRVFQHITKPVLGESRDVLKQDNRHFVIKALSAPGAIIAASFGGFVRVVYESVYSGANSFIDVLNRSLVDSKYEDKLKPVKAGRGYTEQFLGGLGAVIGVGFGIPTALGVVLTRIGITNADAAKRSFAKSVNSTQKAGVSLIDVDPKDDRKPYMKVIGTLGDILGYIAGETGAVSIESAVFFEHSVKTSTNKALADTSDEYQVTVNDVEGHSKLRGILGLSFGQITGGVVFGVIGFVRVISNTVQTVRHVTLDMVRFVRSDDLPKKGELVELSRMRELFSGHDGFDAVPIKEESDDDGYEAALNEPSKTRRDRRKKTPFILGALGLPIGGFTGTIMALVVGSGRIITESAIRAYNDALVITSLILPANLDLAKYKTKARAKVPGILGTPIGFPLGIVFGIAGYAVAFTGRFVVQTIVTTGLATIIIANAPPVNYSKPPEDKRSNFDKGLGLLGTLVAIPFGIVGYALHNTFHIVVNTFVTGFHVAAKMTIWSMGDEKKKFILGLDEDLYDQEFGADKKRTNFEKHGFGLAGYGFVGIGAALGAIVISGRVLLLNFLTTGVKGFNNVAKISLPETFKDKKIDVEVNGIQLGFGTLKLPPTLLKGLKFIFGLPGLIIGGIAAAIGVVLPVEIKNFAVNNYLSFRHLSLSLLNVGLEEPYFTKGVAADKRDRSSKAAGFLGYIAAICTAGLLPVAHNLWKLVVVSVAFSSAVVVAPVKFIAINVSPRFKGEAKDINEQKIRNLYSSLANGDFSEEKPIKGGQSGGKGFVDFFRKSLRLNSSTITEDVLGAVLSSHGAVTGDVLQEIKNTHHGLFFFTKEMRAKRDYEINEEVETVLTNINYYLGVNEAVVIENRDQEVDLVIEPTKQSNRSYADLFHYKAPDAEDGTRGVQLNATPV
jgi:hypothetical protein